MGAHLSRDQETQLEAAFNRYDKDGNGFVDVRELAAGLGLEDVRDDVLRELMGNADSNKDGKMDLKEWKTFVVKRFMQSFEQYDRNGDGKITVDEMRASYRRHKKRISERELADICARIDPNRDGVITLVEYVEGLFLAFAL